MCLSVCLSVRTHVCMHLCLHGGQKKLSGPSEPELQVLVGCLAHVGAGVGTLVLIFVQQVLLIAEPSFWAL